MPDERSVQWKSSGSSTTSPKAITVRTDVRVKVDEYYVVVGFEVNRAIAFVNGTHDIGAGGYGHAFFYLVKNKLIFKVFSFGPRTRGKVGWSNRGEPGQGNKYNTGAVIKDGEINSRPATADFPISEPVKAFRLKLTLVQATKLATEIDKVRKEIQTEEYTYSAIVNDTCAESAKEILDDADIETPSGHGAIKDSRKLSFPIMYAVNPYKWHHNFKKAGHPEVTYNPPGVPSTFVRVEWHPPVGKSDPIFKHIP